MNRQKMKRMLVAEEKKRYDRKKEGLVMRLKERPHTYRRSFERKS